MCDNPEPLPNILNSQGPPPTALQGPLPTTTDTTFVVQTTGFGETPQEMTCTSCRTRMVTRVVPEKSTTQHVAFIILLFVCFPCSCVPYCMDSLVNIKHECPRCNTHLGTYKR